MPPGGSCQCAVGWKRPVAARLPPTPVGSTPQELAALIKKEAVMYAKLVKQIGFKPQ